MTLPLPIRTPDDLEPLRFGGPDGLVPVIAQDHRSGRVLMLAWANREALERTLESGELHFWSRARRQLWKKGETSGNVLQVRALSADCDADTVLAQVDPAGPVCHTGARTCFGDRSSGGLVDRLWRRLEARKDADPATSYTAELLQDENRRLKKLGEEATELVVALARREGTRIDEEAADLLYHTLVALLGAGRDLDDLLGALAARER
ncbi:MAG: bifunctional phosphoribosyl-AMP cyclohydrolase/phosphoribosyl-ATP diphosphatase HisIE [Gemmatimonadetes bacterium]|nr:bifunctional phosphoribosyl-AMP cyclohydrolase/phosphoribosyl-ATP diphosphatase HisIE [Gemmatimonadota bacterium]